MRKSRKSIAFVAALALVAMLGVGGAIAWLTDTSGPVRNSFTVGDVEITLKESPLSSSGMYGDPAEGVSNAYEMIPGFTYKKDPVVSVANDSEDCILFVKFEENNNPSTYLDYVSTLSVANGWTQGAGSIPSNVWYREVKQGDATKTWRLLADDEITVKADAVTKQNMSEAAAAELVYTAYAIQLYKTNGVEFTPEEAWAEVAN